MQIKLSDGGNIFLLQFFNTKTKISYAHKSPVVLSVPFDCINSIIELPGQRLLCSNLAATFACLVDMTNGNLIKKIPLPQHPQHAEKTLTIQRMVLLQNGLIAYSVSYAIDRAHGIAIFDYHTEQLVTYAHENHDVRCLVALPNNRLAVGSDYQADINAAICIYAYQQQQLTLQSTLANLPAMEVHDLALDDNNTLLAFIMPDDWRGYKDCLGQIYNFDLNGVQVNPPKQHDDLACDFSDYSLLNVGLMAFAFAWQNLPGDLLLMVADLLSAPEFACLLSLDKYFATLQAYYETRYLLLLKRYPNIEPVILRALAAIMLNDTERLKALIDTKQLTYPDIEYRVGSTMLLKDYAQIGQHQACLDLLYNLLVKPVHKHDPVSLFNQAIYYQQKSDYEKLFKHYKTAVCQNCELIDPITTAISVKNYTLLTRLAQVYFDFAAISVAQQKKPLSLGLGRSRQRKKKLAEKTLPQAQYIILLYIIEKHELLALNIVLDAIKDPQYKAKLINQALAKSLVNSEKSVLHCAVEVGFLKGIKCLVAHGADVNIILNGRGTGLHVAVVYGQSKIIAYLLSLATTDINKKGYNFATPLIYACMKNNPEIIRLLLANGANCYIADGYGFLPIHLAIIYNSIDSTKILIEHDPQLVNAYTANIDQNNRMTPALQATNSYNLPILKFLHKNKADLLLTDNNNHNCFDLALIEQKIEIVKWMLSLPEIIVKAYHNDLLRCYCNEEYHFELFYLIKLKSMLQDMEYYLNDRRQQQASINSLFSTHNQPHLTASTEALDNRLAIAKQVFKELLETSTPLQADKFKSTEQQLQDLIDERVAALRPHPARRG